MTVKMQLLMRYPYDWHFPLRLYLVMILARQYLASKEQLFSDSCNSTVKVNHTSGEPWIFVSVHLSILRPGLKSLLLLTTRLIVLSLLAASKLQGM